MRYLLTLAVIVLLPLQAVAQDYGKRTLNYCTMRMSGEKMYGYGDVNPYGRLGAYQFGVSDLFDAGVCTGAPPAYNSSQWQLCNFRGLVAVDNFVTKATDILGRGDTQDLYMSLIRKKIIARNQALWISNQAKPYLTYDNSRDMLAALMYRKGAKAVQLYLITDINAVDKNAYSISQYWKALSDCAGGNKRAAQRTVRENKPTYNPATKVPLDFNWQPLTKDVADQVKAYATQPIDTISGAIADNDLSGILYDRIDLNGDGQPGYQFMINTPDYCGTGGCLYVITENGGALAKVITTTKPRPAVNGVYVNGVYNSF